MHSQQFGLGGYRVALTITQMLFSMNNILPGMTETRFGNTELITNQTDLSRTINNCWVPAALRRIAAQRHIATRCPRASYGITQIGINPWGKRIGHGAPHSTAVRTAAFQFRPLQCISISAPTMQFNDTVFFSFKFVRYHVFQWHIHSFQFRSLLSFSMTQPFISISTPSTFFSDTTIHFNFDPYHAFQFRPLPGFTMAQPFISISTPTFFFHWHNHSF